MHPINNSNSPYPNQKPPSHQLGESSFAALHNLAQEHITQRLISPQDLTTQCQKKGSQTCVMLCITVGALLAAGFLIYHSNILNNPTILASLIPLFFLYLAALNAIYDLSPRRCRHRADDTHTPLRPPEDTELALSLIPSSRENHAEHIVIPYTHRPFLFSERTDIVISETSSSEDSDQE